LNSSDTEVNHLNIVGSNTIRYETEQNEFMEAEFNGMEHATVTKVEDLGEDYVNTHYSLPFVR
jgi:hypothetical protein